MISPEEARKLLKEFNKTKDLDTSDASSLASTGILRIVCAPADWNMPASEGSTKIFRCCKCNTLVHTAKRTVDILSQMDKPEVWCVTCVMPEAMAQSSESEDPNAGN